MDAQVGEYKQFVTISNSNALEFGEALKERNAILLFCKV